MTVPARAAAAVIRASAHGRTSRVTLARALVRSAGRSLSEARGGGGNGDGGGDGQGGGDGRAKKNGENTRIQIQTTARDGKTVGDPKGHSGGFCVNNSIQAILRRLVITHRLRQIYTLSYLLKLIISNHLFFRAIRANGSKWSTRSCLYK